MRTCKAPLSKGKCGLKQSGKQKITQSSGTVFNALACDVVYLVPLVSEWEHFFEWLKISNSQWKSNESQPQIFYGCVGSRS